MLNDCTSYSCKSLGCDYCLKCSHAIWKGEGIAPNGKIWRWEFSPRFGPFFLRKDGELLKYQPVPVENPDKKEHPAWVLFGEWYDKLMKNKKSNKEQ